LINKAEGGFIKMSGLVGTGLFNSLAWSL